jgi:hypothetical protein
MKKYTFEIEQVWTVGMCQAISHATCTLACVFLILCCAVPQCHCCQRLLLHASAAWHYFGHYFGTLACKCRMPLLRALLRNSCMQVPHGITSGITSELLQPAMCYVTIAGLFSHFLSRSSCKIGHAMSRWCTPARCKGYVQ